MKFTKEEKVLLNMYAYTDREDSIEAFRQLLTEAKAANVAVQVPIESIADKLTKMSNQEFDQIEFLPDELIGMLLEKTVEEVTMDELGDTVKQLMEAFKLYS